MKKNLVAVLLIALTMGLVGIASTATAAETKKATSTTKATPIPMPKAKATPTPTPKAKATPTPKAKAKATPTPKVEEMVDGVKVKDLLTGKYNNFTLVTMVIEYDLTEYLRNKVILFEEHYKGIYNYYYDEKSYTKGSDI